MVGTKSDVAGPPPNQRLERIRSAGVRCRQKRSAAVRSAARWIGMGIEVGAGISAALGLDRLVTLRDADGAYQS